MENFLKKVTNKGMRPDFKKDLYFLVLEADWLSVFSLFFSFYLFSNFVFALAFFLIPGGIEGKTDITFLDVFYFSVQTMSTIGYGALFPVGHLANWLVTIEAAYGLMTVAILTGLVFAKISKPHAKIRFSQKAIISPFNGETFLSIRMGNIRENDIVDAKVTLTALVDETTDEGQYFLRMIDLSLERSYTPFFRLSWTLFHKVDSESPLYEKNEKRDKLKAFAVTVTGHDGTFSTTVYGRKVYQTEDLVWDKYFKDIVRTLSDGSVTIDYGDFDHFES